MTALSDSGVPNGRGTGSDLDVVVGNFASLRAFFSQPPIVRPAPVRGALAGWWSNARCLSGALQTNIAFTIPLAIPLSTWSSAVPGGGGQLAQCKLQGVNVGKYFHFPKSRSHGSVIMYRAHCSQLY